MNNSDKILIPNRISHYTTIDGFVGIISSNLFRASNVSFLNDRSELLHALDAAEEAIKTLSITSAYKEWAPYLKRVVKELKNGALPETYAICFCQNRDNLSQWRGYGGNQQGISITFDRRKLSKRLNIDKAKFFSVIYTHAQTASKLRSALQMEIADISELLEIFGDETDEQKYADIFSRVSSLLPKFKHLGFQDEREWRFVIQRKIEPKDVFFRSIDNKIIPYINAGCSDNLLPIHSVTVGPGRDQDLTSRSLQTFLLAKGYKDVKASVSQVPFRQ